MLFKNITILDDNLKVKKNMFVGIKDSRIDFVGEDKPSFDYGNEYDGKGKLLMSGFINSHAHSPMMLMRGYGENLTLQNWLNEKIFPFEAKLTGEAVYYSTLLAMAESFRFGIVSTSDMYYFCEDMIRAIVESGAKNNISRSVTNFSDADLWSLESAKEMKYLYENYNGMADGKIIVDMSLHGEYTSNLATAIKMAEYTKQIGANMHVHVSETRFEHEECIKRHGMTPVQYLNKCGIFDTSAIAAHCIWLEGEDFDILKEKGVTVASNPVSNLKLASGVCNVPMLLDKGVNVSIGTDSVASNNSLNFIEEIKTFALLSKTKFNDPTLITPREALTAATYAGAKAQGRKDCGKLAVGNKADLIVRELDQPHIHPIHDLLTNIVYSASGSDIVLTMVDGKVVYNNGEYTTIDIEKVIRETEKATENILKQL